MTARFPFDNSYARLPAPCFTRQRPQCVPDPRLVAVNRPLAARLGIALPDDPAELALIFSGNALPNGADYDKKHGH